MKIATRVKEKVFGFQVTVYDVEGVQVFEGKNDVGQIEPRDIRGESLGPAKVGEEFTTGNIGHEHVDVQAVLKSRTEIYDERMPDARQDITLGVDMLDLAETNDLHLPKDLHGKDVLRSGSR
jgi:hypothetical protein